MKQVIRYNKNKHQREFHNEDKAKFLHLSSGFGGGKTFSLIQKLLKLSAVNRGFHGGLVIPTFSEFTKDVLPEMEGILENNNIRYKHHRTEHWFQFPWQGRGRLYYVSAKDKIRGPNWAYAGINEATLISHIRYKEVIGRVRVKGAPLTQIISSGTPEGYGHWMQEIFDENPMPNSRIIYGDTRDNIDNLDPDYIQSLIDSYDKTMLDAYLRGMWVNMNSSRFYYAYNPDINHDKSLQQELGLVLVGMDFNVDPMTATCWHWNGVQLKGFDEITIMDGDTYKICEALKARGYTPDITHIYPDPAGKNRKTSGKSDIKILKECGYYNITYSSVAPRMRSRQLNMNKRLESGQIVFNPDKMKGLKTDLAAVEVNPIDNGKVKKDKKLTHYSDGLDYLVDIIMPFEHRKKSKVTQFKAR